MHRTFVIAVLSLLPQLTQASTVVQSITFQALDQNMWKSGSSNSLDYSFFLGQSWDKSDSVGSITAPLGVRQGTELSAETSGMAGLQLELKATEGSVDVTYPGQVTLTLPNTVTSGQNFTVGTSLNLSPGSISTTFPKQEISATNVLEMSASASLRVCAFDQCDSGDTGNISLSGSLDLFSLNKNGDNKLKLLGIAVPVFNFGDTISLPLTGQKQGDIQIDNPNLETSGTGTTALQCSTSPVTHLMTCQQVNTLESSGQVDLLTVHADVLALIPGLPPTSVSIPLSDIPGTSIRLDLAEVNVGAAFGIQQNFSVTAPRVMVTLTAQETHQVVTVPVGQPASIFLPSNLHGVHLTPTYWIDDGETFTNQTLLTVNPDVQMDVLKACALGFCLGPLESAHYELAGLQIPVFQKNIDLDFASIQGDRLTVGSPPQQAAGGGAPPPGLPGAPPPPPPADSVPEPGTWVTLVCGAALVLGGRGRLRRTW